jgi:signal transduction histidine kinase
MHAQEPTAPTAAPPGAVSHRQGEPALTTALDLALRLVPARRASLMLPVGRAGSELRVAAACGLALPLALASPRRLGEPVAGLVAETRLPLLVVGRGSPPGACGRYRTGSFISLPISLGDATCGVLSVADPLDDRAFRPADLLALQSFAGYLSAHFDGRSAQRKVGQLEEVVQGLRRQVIAAQEAERRRIAQDLHDETGHRLIEAIFSLDQEASKLPPDTAADTIVRAARQQLIDCAATLHEAVFALRPRQLEDLGLVAALRRLLVQAEQASGLQTRLVGGGEVENLGREVELAIFRVVQEAVTNVYKHARATTITVSLERWRNKWMIAVEDDGVGLDRPVRGYHGVGGHGLAGMRERVEVLGGTFEIGRGRAGGTRLVAWIPAQQGGSHGRSTDSCGPY